MTIKDALEMSILSEEKIMSGTNTSQKENVWETR
jgi:hypothetical protein